MGVRSPDSVSIPLQVPFQFGHTFRHSPNRRGILYSDAFALKDFCSDPTE
jgi:hypothetical protein